MKRLLPFVLCLFLFPVFYIPAQEGAEALPAPAADGGTGNAEGENAGAESAGTESSSGADPAAAYIEMDIKTSSLTELAAWCRELGLSEGGTKEELSSRLRGHYKLPSPEGTAAGQRIITIESAKTTEYFSLDVVDEEYARLSGDVIISLKEGNAVHRIKAWEILYNRTRNVITASGNVEYVKEDGDTVETFKGKSITVNLDNWSSIFMDGVSERSMAGKATAYRFAGTVISRNAEGATILTGADISNPSNEEAYWSLHASKLWLLPGNDWAILNAVLKVGNIPLLYLPFFYYPADEIVFHPVLGYRSREGTFLQTTTYILGRPKTSEVSENSITKIFGGASENMELRREGVFLRATGEKSQSPNDTRLSLLFDAYVNLGFYLGTELALPAKGAFGETTLSAGIGLTRNIYQMGSASTPFPNYDGTSEWNSAMLFSMGIPLRYRLNASGSFRVENGSFSWALPFYSDPYVDRDFMRRSEARDWISMLRDSASASAEDVDDTHLNSYEWKLSGSYNPNVTNLSPYINSFSITNISSSLLFSARDSRSYSGPATPPNPGKSFFFPNRFTLYSISASMAGKPYTSGTSPEQQPKAETGPAPGDALIPDLPVSPWESAGAAGETEDAPQDIYSLSPPSLGQTFTLPRTGGPELSFDYRLTPTTASELQFRSSAANWEEQEDITWGEVSSILSRIRTDGNLGLNINHSGGGAYSGSLRLLGTGAWQGYMFINEDAEEFSGTGALDAAKNRAYNETYFTSSWDLSTSLKPFYQSSVWGNSSLQYNLRGLLAKTNVDTTGTNPDWDLVMGRWNKDNIDTHQVTANVAANVMDHAQTLSVSAVLPPEDSSIAANAVFRAWISETSIRGRVINPGDSELRKFDPVYFTETLKFGDWGNFQQYVVFDPEKNEYTTLTTSLTLSGFTAAFSAAYVRPWRFNSDFGNDGILWEQLSDESLEPQEFRLGYNKTFSKENLWGKRLAFSVGINTSLAFDLQRYTNSRMSFGLEANLGIANFLDIKFSAYSENAVIYRYFQNLPFFDAPPTKLYSGYETNFFYDLVNSFRFDRPDLRRKTGFKLKNMNLSLIHHLGDWNAKLTISMAPYLDRSSAIPRYEFNNEISFLIQWVPIGEIKTQIDYDEQRFSVK